MAGMAAPLRIGTRSSPLALWQAEWVAAQLRAAGVEVQLVYITTQGGPGNASNTLNIYGFRKGFEFFEIGYASALMITLSAIVLGAVAILTQARKRVAW